MKKVNSKSQKEIEQAVKFLVFSVKNSCRSSKSVIFHSLRTAVYLFGSEYGKDVVVAAVLHDILEDTKVRTKEVRQKFGKKVARLVEANSFDMRIKDKVERYKEEFSRCLKNGKDALIIKAADILDNSNYYYLAESQKMKNLLVTKMHYFIRLSEDILKDEVVLRDLKRQYKRIKKISK